MSESGYSNLIWTVNTIGSNWACHHTKIAVLKCNINSYISISFRYFVNDFLAPHKRNYSFLKMQDASKSTLALVVVYISGFMCESVDYCLK